VSWFFSDFYFLSFGTFWADSEGRLFVPTCIVTLDGIVFRLSKLISFSISSAVFHGNVYLCTFFLVSFLGLIFLTMESPMIIKFDLISWLTFFSLPLGWL
jgi:hypothetical protein